MAKFKIEQIKIGDEIIYRDKNSKEGTSTGRVVNKLDNVLFVEIVNKFSTSRIVDINDVVRITGK